jgi:hypothetical protein
LLDCEASARRTTLDKRRYFIRNEERCIGIANR